MKLLVCGRLAVSMLLVGFTFSFTAEAAYAASAAHHQTLQQRKSLLRARCKAAVEGALAQADPSGTNIQEFTVSDAAGEHTVSRTQFITMWTSDCVHAPTGSMLPPITITPVPEPSQEPVNSEPT